MNKKEYDEALSNHRMKVEEYIYCISTNLLMRGMCHDSSKYKEPEYSAFLKATNMRDCEYDSEEYRKRLASLANARSYHYLVNSHHPQHYRNGVNGMDLMDVIEMLCDWKASVCRNRNEGFAMCLKLNIKRFKIDEQLGEILTNTAERLWPEDFEKKE